MVKRKGSNGYIFLSLLLVVIFGTSTVLAKTEINIYSEGLKKIRFEAKNGQLVVKTEDEIGEIKELNQQEAEEVENQLKREGIKIATGQRNTLVFSKGTATAEITLPLSFEPLTKIIMVERAKGKEQKIISPDTVLNNIIVEKAIIKRINNNPIELVDRGGTLVFEIPGIRRKKLFALFPVSIKKNVLVNAETLEVVDEEESFLTRFLDSFSF